MLVIDCSSAASSASASPCLPRGYESNLTAEPIRFVRQVACGVYLATANALASESALRHHRLEYDSEMRHAIPAHYLHAH